MKIAFFITLILSVAFRPLMPMIDYALNYDKIINELCENREEPELLCNGFCYLKTEVKKSEQNSSKNKFTKNQIKIFEALISEKQEVNQSSFIKNLSNNTFDSYQNNYSNQLIKNIFHPPIV